MSTDIIAQLKQNALAVTTGVDEDTLAVAGGSVNNGTKRISIRGGVFRKVVGGKEVASIEDRNMNVIITKMAHNASRTFYDTSYKEGEKVAPVCWSNDSNKPDPEVENPPASACNQCPHSVRGAEKSCRLSWRTAVVLPDDPSGDVLQLVLPATSAFGKEDNGKWPFRPYIQMLASNNISASKVITKMQFDTKSPTPKILFSPAGIVPEEHHALIDEQKKSQAAQQAVNLTVYQADSSSSTENKAEAPQTQAKSNPEPVQTDAVTDDVEEPIKREADKPQAEKVNDVSDVINKWATK